MPHPLQDRFRRFRGPLRLFAAHLLLLVSLGFAPCARQHAGAAQIAKPEQKSYEWLPERNAPTPEQILAQHNAGASVFDTKVRFWGRVLDQNGNPLEGVTVKASVARAEFEGMTPSENMPPGICEQTRRDRIKPFYFAGFVALLVCMGFIPRVRQHAVGEEMPRPEEDPWRQCQRRYRKQMKWAT